MIHKRFPHIYCINLDSRLDRKQESSIEFLEHLIAAKWFPAVNGKAVPLIPGCNAGNTGCILSHLSLIVFARENNFPSIVIFEDDVEFSEDFNDKLQYIPEQFGVLYFGGSDKYATIKGTDNPHIAVLRGVLCTHAYIVDASMYDVLIDALSKADAPIDVIYSRLQEQYEFLGFRPKIAWQRESYSDIINKKIRYKSTTNEPNPKNEW